jgi:LPS sulfotransferase NodH
MMACEFVLVAEHRTGSTYLMNALNSHDNIMCDNELFNQKAIVHYRGLRGPERNRKAIWARNRDPVGYMQAFFAAGHAQEVQAKGFNLMLGHSADVLMEITSGKYKVIQLCRDNKLAQYASFLKGLKTKKWATKDEEIAKQQREDKSQRVAFQYTQFENWLQKQNTMAWQFEALCRAKGVDFLKVDYVSVAKGQADVGICAFLGVADKVLSSDLKKQGSSNILDRYTKPKAVTRYLEVIGKPDWAQEAL